LKHLKIYENFQDPSISELNGLESPQDVAKFLSTCSSTEKEAMKALELIQSPKIRNIVSSSNFMEYAEPILKRLYRYKNLEPIIKSLFYEIKIGDLEREKKIDFSPIEMIYHKDSDDLKP
jgi:hypothetical protein